MMLGCRALLGFGVSLCVPAGFMGLLQNPISPALFIGGTLGNPCQRNGILAKKNKVLATGTLNN